MFLKEKTITVTVDDYKSKEAIFSLEFEGQEGHTCLVEVLPEYEYGENPRDWSNLWTWVTTDKAGYSDIKYRGTKERSWRDRQWYKPEDFEDSDTGKLDKQFLKENIVMPLYLYRHSGDVISVGRFPAGSPCDCPWDSGCMGFAFVSKKELKKEYCVKRITKKVLENARERLEGEVKVMNMRNAGEVYGITVVDMVTDQQDSCWGFYCDSRKEIAECARDMLCGFVKEGEEQLVAERLVA